MRVVIIENTNDNLILLRNCIHSLLPNALVMGFTDGNEAEKWCENHSGEIDVYFGNWWGTTEEFETPEGSAVWKYVDWQKKPVIICTGDEEQFEKWSVENGADAFIRRPITLEKVRDMFEELGI